MPSLARKIVPAPTEATDRGPAEPPAEPLAEWPQDLDLERLVWDPEYREEMRARLRPRR